MPVKKEGSDKYPRILVRAPEELDTRSTAVSVRVQSGDRYDTGI